VAKSKKFVLPPIDYTPEDEVQLMKTLDAEYMERFSAMTQYLYEDHVRNSDVGDVAIKEAAREAEEHRELVLENEEDNRRVAEARSIRLQEEERQQLTEAKEKIKLAEAEDAERLRKAAVTVTKEADSLKNSVTLETLRKALEDAVDNPVDYEYAIDTEGHIYRGRYTKSMLVPPEQREKIPVPQSDILIKRN
jgi:small subunit ribosomal protein S26